ncbi:uncharacterized protein LOC109795708 [Cajanus cajan]|uniref:uncharacterized protein LOC109795708 n=1 Tax=Cajanus cajan TaxID=3821 RepID=UPI00098D9FF1|nr:uncharacterized protein LOC109795708 [Cajanus cajan]
MAYNNNPLQPPSPPPSPFLAREDTPSPPGTPNIEDIHPFHFDLTEMDFQVEFTFPTVVMPTEIVHLDDEDVPDAVTEEKPDDVAEMESEKPEEALANENGEASVRS